MPVPQNWPIQGLLEFSLLPGRAILGVRKTWARPKCFVCARRVEARDEVRLRGMSIHHECSYYAPGAAKRVASPGRLEIQRPRPVAAPDTPRRLAA